MMVTVLRGKLTFRGDALALDLFVQLEQAKEAYKQIIREVLS